SLRRTSRSSDATSRASVRFPTARWSATTDASGRRPGGVLAWLRTAGRSASAARRGARPPVTPGNEPHRAPPVQVGWLRPQHGAGYRWSTMGDTAAPVHEEAQAHATPAAAPAYEAEGVPVGPLTPAGVLALQRAAGNRAARAAITRSAHARILARSI